MQDTSEQPPESSKTSLPWLKLVKLFGMLILVVLVLQRVNWQEIRQHWKNPPLWSVLVMSICIVCSMSVRVVKWGWQARWSGFLFVWRRLAQSYLSGLLVGFLTPLRVGEVARVTALSLPEETTLSRPALTAAVLFLEKLYELAVLALMVALGLGFAFGLWQLGLLVGLGGLVLCGALLLPINPPERWIEKCPSWLQRFVLRPFLQAKSSLSSKRLSALMGMTLLAHLLNLTCGLLIFRMFGEIGAVDFFSRVPILTLINNLPITIAGIGVRELGAMQLFTSTTLTASSAAVAASLFFVLTNILPTIAWIPLEWWPSKEEVS